MLACLELFRCRVDRLYSTPWSASCPITGRLRRSEGDIVAPGACNWAYILYHARCLRSLAFGGSTVVPMPKFFLRHINLQDLTRANSQRPSR